MTGAPPILPDDLSRRIRDGETNGALATLAHAVQTLADSIANLEQRINFLEHGRERNKNHRRDRVSTRQAGSA